MKQGRIDFRNAQYTSELIGKLGYRTPVEVRAPLRTGVDHVFIRRNGIPCGEANPDQAYDTQDRRGAEEAGRRIKEHKGAIRELEAQLTPGFDGFEELTRNTTAFSPGQEQPGIIMRLAGEEPEARIAREAMEKEAESKRWKEIMAQANEVDGQTRKASGGNR